jgi:heme A synthase
MREAFPSRLHVTLLLATSTLTFLLVVLGGVVCTTDASGGCPDWPTCHGRFLPPLSFDSILEYAHRVWAGLTSLAILAATVVSWRQARALRWVSRPPLIALGFLVVVSILGAIMVVRGLSPLAAAADLGSALAVLALILVATVVAVSQRRNPGLGGSVSFHGAFARLVLWASFVAFVVLVSGVFAARSNPLLRCLGWPSFWALQFPVEATRLPQMTRWVGACLVGILIFAVVVQAWRLHRPTAPILRAAAAVGVLFLAESMMGLALQATGFPMILNAVHVLLAALLWSSLIVLATLAGLWTR